VRGIRLFFPCQHWSFFLSFCIKIIMSKKNKPRQSKRKRQLEEEEQKERRLVASLFGSDSGEVEEDADGEQTTENAVAIGSSGRHVQSDSHDDEDDDDDLQLGIEMDRVGDTTANVDHITEKHFATVDLNQDNDDEDIESTNDNMDDNTNVHDTDTKEEQKSGVAWMDHDDAEIANVDMMGSSSRIRKLRKHKMEATVSGTEYRERLRERFVTTTSISARVDWADVPNNNTTTTQKEEDLILSSSAPLLSSSRQHRTLPRDIIQMERCWFPGDVRKSIVSAVHFHPQSDPDVPILLTAGLDKSLQFFRILGNQKSEKIHGIHCKWSVRISLFLRIYMFVLTLPIISRAKIIPQFQNFPL
jgi:hypothetical protein